MITINFELVSKECNNNFQRHFVTNYIRLYIFFSCIGELFNHYLK